MLSVAKSVRRSRRWPTRDGLYRWLAKVARLRIPRRAVCPGHDAPFDFVWSFFAHEVNTAVILANRGGGKTANVASLHLANGNFKEGFETSHIGAIEIQAKRAYRYYRQALRHPSLRNKAPDPHIRETIWTNGSWIEILPGTEAQTQGGHPYLVAFDELESGKRQPYENAKAMPSEWRDDEGVNRTGQFLATSTRVTALGMMQAALDEAEERGTRVWEWCIFETMQPCDGQDGRPPCSGEACPIWQWCEGRAVHADGWRSLDDVLAFYSRVSLDTWLAQALCQKPEARALIYSNFSATNISDEADYAEDAGPIYLSYDWGFTDAYHVGLWQRVDGVYHMFDELTGNETSEREIIRAVVKRITELPGYDGPSLDAWGRVWSGADRWPRPWPQIWPEIAAGDPSAVQFRAELKAHGIAARTPKRVKHDVESGQDVTRAAISTAGGLVRLLIHPRNATAIKAFQSYRAKELPDGSFSPRPDPDAANHRFSHPCDSTRYFMWSERRSLGLASIKAGDSDEEGE